MNTPNTKDFYVCLVITAIFVTINAVRNVTRKANELVDYDPDAPEVVNVVANDFKVGSQAKPASYVDAAEKDQSDTNTTMVSSDDTDKNRLNDENELKAVTDVLLIPATQPNNLEENNQAENKTPRCKMIRNDYANPQECPVELKCIFCGRNESQ